MQISWGGGARGVWLGRQSVPVPWSVGCWVDRKLGPRTADPGAPLPTSTFYRGAGDRGRSRAHPPERVVGLCGGSRVVGDPEGGAVDQFGVRGVDRRGIPGLIGWELNQRPEPNTRAISILGTEPKTRARSKTGQAIHGRSRSKRQFGRSMDVTGSRTGSVRTTGQHHVQQERERRMFITGLGPRPFLNIIVRYRE